MLTRLTKSYKCKRCDLASSKFELARLMAGRSSHIWKYLTKKQADQVSRYGIPVYALDDSDKKYLESLDKLKSSKPKKSKSSSTLVTYKDEDGIHKIKFTSREEANKWISFMESSRSSGNKFELIDP